LQRLRASIYATFSPDGKRAVIASRNVARVWPVFQSPQDLLDRARSLKPRPLSAAQRRRNFNSLSVMATTLANRDLSIKCAFDFRSDRMLDGAISIP
jgi:hypothetical protein